MTINQITIQRFLGRCVKPCFFIGLRHPLRERAHTLHEDLLRLFSGKIATDQRHGTCAYLLIKLFMRWPVPAGRIETGRYQIGTGIGGKADRLSLRQVLGDDSASFTV